MSIASSRVRILTLLLFLCIAAPFSLRAASANLHLEVLLVWGTNDQPPPEPKLKPVEPELAQKLQKAYKWKKYFEVNRKTVKISEGANEQLTMSEHCSLQIKNLVHERVEVRLIGEGKPVSRHLESLPKGHTLILAGDAKNDTAWFIVLRQIKN